MKSDAALAGLTLAQRSELLNLARARDLARRGSELPPIDPAPRDGPVPLSFAQQRLWFLAQLRDLGSTYHIHRAVRLRGGLDRAALRRALDRIVARHEALRTTFAEVDGVPRQCIAPADAGFHLLEHALDRGPNARAELEWLTADEAHAPFDLERGPLIRGRLVRLGADDHVLMLTMHHIVSDAWSMGVLTRELGVLYDAFRRGDADPLPPLRVQYADYAAWQRRWVEGSVLQAQAEYWTRTLGDAPELLELPTDRARPAQMDPSAGQVAVVLDAELTAALKALSRRTGTTPFMTLLAGWAAVLGRLSGQADVVVGTPMAGRGRPEIEGLIGFFVNTLALRVDLAGTPTVAELLQRVKGRALEAQRHQDIPFEQVVERVAPVRSQSHTPVFQVLFAWQDAVHARGLSLPGLESDRAASASSRAQANRDLSLSLREADSRIVGSVAYATALFDRATVERWVGYLRRALEEMAADEHRPVERLAIVPPDERARVLEEWNRTEADYPAGLCVHELVQARAARTPDAAAVAFGDERLSYGALNAAANRLAHELRARGVGPDARVAVCMERGPRTVVGILAVLKAGGAYVPLDPDYPAERLAYMLADSAPAVVLTQARLRDRVEQAAAPVLCLDDNALAWADRPAADPARGALTPEHLAYVIYTSGSTGTPKGVGVPHRALASQLAWGQRTWALAPHESVLQRISLSFDVSVRELFWPLTVGARLVLAPPGHGDPDVLVETIARQGIGAVHMVPSLLQPFLEHPRLGECAHLARVMCGGEVLSPALVRRFHERLPNAALYHMYGPTETTVGVTAARCEAGAPDGRLSLGRPVANTRAYVLDGRGEPVPLGAAGELYVGGAQLARGYLDRPGQTAERFVPDPFSGHPGARLYRTGDRVRWLPGGELEFLGRVDHQVKVRGFRVEPGEIEARLREHPDVREAVVLVREDAPGDTRLVAYVAGGPAAGAEVLRAHLRERLPDYMVPAAYVHLPALPLGPNGKVDRGALPAPEGGAFAARAYAPPAGDTERALAEIWAEVLGVERVGRRDHFFELGGHSLLAVRVVSRVRQALHAEVALGQVFALPVLADFARALETAARAELPPIEPASREGRLPLSFAQQRLWFLEQLGDLGSTYHMRRRLRLRGALDRGALVRALDGLVARHEALRTTLVPVDGVPEQRIAPADAGFLLREHDLAGRPDAEAELGRLLDEEAHARFDLARGPLIRGRLVRMAADDHVLAVTMHHVVSDGWSMGVLLHEVSALYAAHAGGREPALAPLPVQYADYAAWQRRWVEGEVLEAQAAYWTRTLAGAPELLELPVDRPRAARLDPAGARVGVELDEALTAGLNALSRRHGATLFMTVLAGWAAVLGRLSGQDDVVVGTPVANRGRREVEGLIGFFVNTLALRVDLSGSPTVAELLGRVKERALAAQHHQDIPFEQVVERVAPARSLSHTPLFQVMFAWQNAPSGRLELPGLALGPVEAAEDRGTAKQDLGLTLGQAGGRIVGSVTYATSLLEHRTVERWVGYLRRVLEAMVADENRRVARLPMLPPEERARVLEAWNRTEADAPGASFAHALFERQVQRAPEALALGCGRVRLSYAELNARVNRLAHHLRALGVGPDARVAIGLERGPEVVVALLAVLKAGGAYVPVDPDYPPQRLRWMLEDSAPELLLTTGALAPRFADAGVPLLDLAGEAAWAGAPATDLERGGLRPEHAAYVIYTSGSTGRPKGAVIQHRNVCGMVAGQLRSLPLEPESRVLQFASFSFDGSVYEVFLALARGASLHLPEHPGPLAGDDLVRTVAQAGITHAILPPAVLAALPAGERLPSIHTLIVSGDAPPVDLMARWSAGRRLINGYGPTEATVCTTLHDHVAGTSAPPPIGRPVANVRVYLLDAAGEPVPRGTAGELHVGGATVGRGYWRRPALTAERFVPDPFGAEPGARLYRTGDRARWNAEGALEFAGRVDAQVKVRGFRVELGEIEARLREHPAVQEAVVVARLEEGAAARRLVAYWVGGAVEPEALRAHLLERLPDYMVPAAYVRLPALPLNPSGKVDRRALPAPEGDAFARRGYQAPVGPTETALAEIWMEVLGTDRVGRDDGFFALGGHSLLAVTLIARMRARGLHADVRALFTAPTLADFAAAVGVEPADVRVPANGIPADSPLITPEMLTLVSLTQPEIDAVVATVPGGAANVQDIYPLAPLQEGFLFHHLATAEGDPYLLGTVSRFPDRERLDAYLAAFGAVIARHDILRTAIAWENVPEPVQVVWRRAPLPVEEVELDPADGDVAGQLYRRFDPRHHRIDVRRAPLLRACVAREADGERWVLLLLLHHLAGDHTTMDVLRHEVQAHLQGRADALLPPVPFRTLVAQARLGVSREEHRAFFTEMLGDVDAPTAPFGLVDVRGDGSGIEQARLEVDAGLAARLRERARALGVSAATLCHVAWAQVLGRASGRDDVVFGTVLFGRMQGGEGAERVLGPFLNTLPVRIRLGSAGVEASVRQAHARLAALLRHEHAPLSLAQRCSGVEAPAPLFTSLLNYRHGGRKTPANAPAARPAAGRPGGSYTQERSNYPLTMSVDDRGEAMTLTAKVATHVRAGRVCAMMHTALEGLVQALETAPERAVGGIAVLPPDERALVLEGWNRTEADYDADACVHELFEAQASRTPDAPAVVFPGGHLTYAALNARANRLAHHLARRGVGPDIPVGLCLERGPEMVVALFAVLKAGGVYVPLDGEYPEDRLRYMLADSAPAVLVTQASLAHRFAGAKVPCIRVDADAAAWAGEAETNPPRGTLTPDHLVYVIYTSGSTGQPKGVMNQHRALVNRLAWGRRAWAIGADEAVLCKTSLNFDGSVREIFLPLAAGGRVVLAAPGGHRDPAYLLEVIGREKVTTVNLVPSLLQALLDAENAGGLRGLRRILCGGEALPGALLDRCRRRLPGVELHNLYGPSEAATAVTAPRLSAEDGGAAVPIGAPSANARVYVLDGRGEPVPVGVAGELFIGGVPVARGYLRRPGLTAERFVPDPFGTGAGARLYRTGDVVRWLSDGRLAFVGRNDDQVKVRGFRVEPGEVEARLRAHPAVAEAVVVARQDPGAAVHRLVAYWVGGAVQAEALRAHLLEGLPEYMVPAAYVHLDALPLDPNGKVARRALPAPGGDAFARGGYQAPVGPTETALAEIWAEVLGVDRVGRDDGFFALGGHSLLAVTLTARMRARGLHADVGTVFTAPTLAALAAAVSAEHADVQVPPNGIPDASPVITPEMLPLVALTQAEIDGVVATVPGGAANVQDVYPLAPLQEGFLFHHLATAEGDPYLMGSVTRFPDRARLDAHLAAFGAVVARHDILRTAIVWEGLPEPVQVVWRQAPLPVEEVELDPAGGDAAGQLYRRFDPRRHRIDVRRAPLLRCHVAREADGEGWVLLLLLHHLAGDHTAKNVLRAEIQAHLAGAADALPPPVPFRNLIAQARLGVSREEHRAFFHALLGDVDAPTAPFGLLDARGDGSGMDEARVRVDPRLAGRVRERARALGVSAAALCHVAWGQVLGRASGRDDVVFGTVLVGRMQGGEGAERVIGPFINTLPIRVRLGGAGVEASVRQTHALLAGLLRHEHASLALAQRCSRVEAPAPLFTALLNYRHRVPAAAPRAASEGRRSGHPAERTNYPLAVSVDDQGDAMALTAQVQAQVEAGRVCALMITALEGLVEALETAPERAVGSLEVLPAEERARVVDEWNRTEADYPAASCIHALVEARAAQAPDAPAVVCEGESLSYGALNARANQLAHHLRALGVGPDVRVAICVERSPEMLVGLLGILKAGGAYVPLDPAYPADRLEYMLADSAPAAVLTQAGLRGRVDGAGVPVLELDAAAPAWADGPATNPEPGALTPAHLAYVVYTSGSTGRPKGVMVAHAQLSNLVHWHCAAFGVGPGTRSSSVASLGFDAATWEIWPPLAGGGELHLPGRGRVDPDAILDWWDGQALDVSFLPTPMAEYAFSRGVAAGTVRTLLVGGDRLRRVPAEPMPFRLVNNYGPTETTVVATSGDVRGQATPGIGRPVGNTRTYLLDRRGEPVPVGVSGELYVGGAQVARGYLGRAGLTAERFVPDPFGGEAGARMYRTGDLCRWTAEGTLDFVGRVDHQVKVRGFRIELGEIEARLAEHPAVREAVVLAREDAPGDTRLVAYWVGEGEVAEAPRTHRAETAGADVLRAHLSERLPAYMVPAGYVRLEALPLTTNGKVDRGALPAPEGDAYAAGAYESPVGAVETALAEIWGEVLGVGRVGRHDGFFALGGHSLLAVALVARMRARGLHADVRTLFATPTLAALAAAVGGEHAQVQVPPNGIPADSPVITPEMLPLVALGQAEIDAVVATVPGGAANVQDIYPLAPLQEGFLFHHLATTEGDPYLLPGSLTRFATRERLDAYLRALGAVMARHDILRTSIAWENVPEPVQVVWRQAPLPVEEVALDPADGDVAGQLSRRFDPRHHRIDVRRAPLMRACVARDADGAWLLLLLRHHLTVDHTAMDVLREEVQAHLDGRADALPAPVPFRAFVAQARLGVSPEEHRDFFREMLSDVDEPTAPFGLLDARGDGSGIEQARLYVEDGLAARLRERARALGVSAAALCHVAWAQVLARASGRDDVVFGSVLFGRMQGGEGAERVIGPFINTLPVRVRLGGAGVETGVRQTHALLTRLLRHEHASLALAQRCSGVEAPAPLFTSLLNYRYSKRRTSHAPAGRTSRGGERTNYPLTLSVDDLGDGFALTAQAPAAVQPLRVCEMMHAALESLGGALETAPGAALDRLDVLPPAERARVVEAWNRTDADYPAGSCLHELFEAQVTRTPDAAAVVFEGEEISYAELNRRANRLAHRLRALGVGPEVRVALCMERGLEMVVSLLATLKAGGAYVPLDPEHPAERLRHALTDSRPAVLLSQRALAGTFAEAGVPVLAVDAGAPAWAGRPDTNPGRAGLAPGHLAYVIYTSGSTGVPKGVMNTHRGVVNRLLWMQDAYGLDAGDAVLQKTPYSFDVSVWEFFWTLATGARLVMARPGGHRDPGYLVETIRRHAVTTVHFVPSMLPPFLEHPDADSCTGLRRVFCSGEALPPAVAEQFLQRITGSALYNLYGPTEAAVDVTAWRCLPGEAARARVPLGRPIANTRMYVLDPRGAPVPAGVAGELYIGGVQVARGYQGRPRLTAERFVPDPFGGPGARLYRTGDLGRWLADGTLEYLGRNDFQVKVRGFRIEPGEIEARLLEHPAVQAAVVVARDHAPGGTRLVAYFVSEGAVQVEGLRAHLAGQLPEYMVPAAFVRLDALPLSPNGKLDRGALPAPGDDAYARDGFEAPMGDAEQALAGIWAEVLGVERVGRHDNFFALGGHSLLAVRVIARMRQALGVEIPLTHVFSHPTVESLAARLAAPEAPVSADRAVAVRATGSEPPLFLAYTGAGSVGYAQKLHPHLGEDVPVYALPAPPLSDAQPRTVEAMAARLLRMIREVQPAGPYRVGGWSFGGVLAYEIAAQLIARDETVEFLGMIDTYPPAYFRAMDAAGAEPAGPVDGGGDAELQADMARLRAEGRLPDAMTVPRFREMRDRSRLHDRAVREYDPRPLPIAVHLFSARESPMRDPSRGWRDLLPEGALQVTTVPGTHDSMMDALNVAVLGQALSRRMEAAAGSRSITHASRTPR